MVKRMPPLAVAVIGTGETSTKNVEAQLTDFTSPYSDVTFIFPVDEEHWTPTIEAAFDWAVENEIPYVAVTSGSTPSKGLVPVLEGAEETLKVARVSTKMVQLLQAQIAEGEKAALIVAWDDDDAEAVTAVNKALNAEVDAFNLLDGLDKFEFDGEDDDEPVGEAAEDAAQPPLDEEDQRDVEAFVANDEYDSWGIRKLRAELRNRESGFTDKQIGAMDKDDAVEALRALDSGSEPEEPKEETRTTRARRAFAEGAAEGTGDEAQTLPRSKGSDILDNEDDEPTYTAEPLTVDEIVGAEIVDKGITGPSLVDGEDVGLRHRALELAISSGKSGVEAITDAERYALYLKGERRAPGRPRADGSPAQPREINPETGKPVRRRAPRSTE